jgi:hypothetical protein
MKFKDKNNIYFDIVIMIVPLDIEADVYTLQWVLETRKKYNLIL